MSSHRARIREELRRSLSLPLPGREAQRALWPTPESDRWDGADVALFDSAAVLLAVHAGETTSPETDRFCLPLIRRPRSMRHHGGQISLPGGECAPGESCRECALREAEEEIGLPASAVDVLGCLTPVPVPVSRYRIQPVVAWVEREPAWIPHEREVDAILAADPDRLLVEGPRGSVERERDGVRLVAPAYIVPDSAGAEALVWGATAIILAEFLAVWRRARSSTRKA